MPVTVKYQAGERVDFIPLTSGDPESAVFQLTDEDSNPVMQPLTVANGGLEPRRKRALHPVFNAPHMTGRYKFTFRDSTQEETGTLIIQAARTAPQAQPARAQQPQPGRPNTGPRLGIIE